MYIEKIKTLQKKYPIKCLPCYCCRFLTENPVYVHFYSQLIKIFTIMNKKIQNTFSS